MIHIFDTDIASEYGVNAAIILQNIGYWIKQNEANQTNYYDGNYWTFNSRRAYRELFPYMSERQINTAFEKLINGGIIITGNYNKLAYDRTLWYALTQKGKCILHFDIMDNDNSSNGSNQNGKPIPNINTDVNAGINPITKKESKKNSFDEIITAYADNLDTYQRETVINLLGEWLKVRKAKRAAMTDTAIQLNINKLDKLAKESKMSVTEYLQEVICRGWAAFFKINNYDKKEEKPTEQTPENIYMRKIQELEEAERGGSNDTFRNI